MGLASLMVERPCGASFLPYPPDDRDGLDARDAYLVLMGLPANHALRGVAEPTLDEVMRLVELADTGGHWYWLGDVVRDGLDPVPVLKRDGSQWVVVRLLVSGAGRVRRVNRCGLRTCVNPGHWAVVSVEDGVTLTDFDGSGWRRA